MDSQLKGDLAELRVAARLKQLGFTVLFPFTESQHYDLAVEQQGEFWRIQVKSSTLQDNGTIKFMTYGTNSSKTGNNATFYTKEMIDGIAVFNNELQRCFYVPVEETNKYSMTLNPDNDSKNPADYYDIANIK